MKILLTELSFADMHPEWILAVTGWILYNLYLIQKSHEDFDIDNNGYTLKELGVYFRFRWIGMLFSFILMAIVTLYDFMPEIWDYAVKKFKHPEWKWIEPFYLFTGALASVIQYLINKISKSK